MNVQGISVLSSEVIYSDNWFAGLITIIGFSLIMLAIDSIDSKKSKYIKKYWLQMTLIGIAMIGFANLSKLPIFTYEDCVEYKCIIDETASFTEVYEKFTIEDVEGKIWTIRTKGE